LCEGENKIINRKVISLNLKTMRLGSDINTLAWNRISMESRGERKVEKLVEREDSQV
jgi:hypothetical protein